MSLKDYKKQLDTIYENSEKEFFNYVTEKLKEWNWKYFYLIVGPDEYCDGMSEGVNDWVMTNEDEVLSEPEYPEFANNLDEWTDDQAKEFRDAVGDIDAFLPYWEKLSTNELIRIDQQGKVTSVEDFCD